MVERVIQAVEVLVQVVGFYNGVLIADAAAEVAVADGVVRGWTR